MTAERLTTGIFVSFEGVEGSGKTTQIEKVCAFLDSRGVDYLLTREPGGTDIGERVRDILLDNRFKNMSVPTEALLYAASRAQIVRQRILPALKQGRLVLCDRYVDSSFAYQGYGLGADLSFLKKVNEWATDGLLPDLTVLFDLDPEEGLLRSEGNGKRDRIEGRQLEFHKRVREGYLVLAEESPARFSVIDANRPVDGVCREVLNSLRQVGVFEEVKE